MGKSPIKEFLKPDLRIFALYIVFLLLNVYFGYSIKTSSYGVSNPDKTTSTFNYSGIITEHCESSIRYLAGWCITYTMSWFFIIGLFLFYLLSCFIFWNYDKTKKSKIKTNEFLKLDWRKIVLTIIIVAFYSVSPFLYYTFPSWISYMFAFFSWPMFLPGANTIILIIEVGLSYLISYFIVWIYDKVKKK